MAEQLEQQQSEIETLKAQMVEIAEAKIAAANGNGNASQRIVNEMELEGLLAEGWTVVSVLPSGRIVVREA